MTGTALALIALLLPGAHSQTPPPAADSPGGGLTLSTAVRAALEHYPSVAIAEAGELAATAALDAAKASRLPQAALGGRGIRYQEPAPVTPFHGFSPGSFPEFDRTLVQGEVLLHHSLYSGGARAARIHQAEARTDAAGAALAVSKDQLVARTVSTYLRVLGVADVLAAHDRRLEALEAEHRRVERMLAAGRAAEVDLRRVEASLAAARAERVRLATSLSTAEEDLARLVGASAGTIHADHLVHVELAPQVASSQAATAEALRASNPTLVQARQELLAAEHAVSLVRSERRPDLGLEGRYQELGGSELSFSDEWSVALQVSFTLFDNGARAARLRQANAERDAAAERVRLLETDLRGDLDRARAEVVQAAAQVESLGKAVESFTEVARVERLRLDTGVGIQADYLDAEAKLLAAQADLSEARYGEAVAATEVARIVGRLDPTWVETNLSEATR